MPEVFISFVHEEEEVAKAVQKFIGKVLQGKTQVFMSADTTQIHAGELWLERIAEELKKSKVVILMLSPLSVGRPWVNFEAGGAFLTDKRIIPVCFDGLTQGNLPKPYSNFQAVGLETDDDYYYLVRSVCRHLNRTCPPLPPKFVSSLNPELEKLRAPYRELRRALDRRKNRPSAG
jgi:TIR domain